ncbi:hypothetical protein RCF98_16940 [Thiothrix lacustris]|uniref:Uncharacterized protein n=1 Tax=Thiothrix lacustris TaxID=525917 RepID=A0ABY9MQ37_9GAMM|nr:hypothetical protein [Thiothrix lacustris]WML90643.1 hypothetical protein RCF98_16940 [Thiothrix lacustris]
MNTVILDVRTLKDSLADPNNQTLGNPQSYAGCGVLSIREVARRVNRDVKAVHGDVHVLLNAGLLKKSDDGVLFPYSSIHVDFMLQAAA